MNRKRVREQWHVWEDRLHVWLLAHLPLLFGVTISLIGLALRLSVRHYVSWDADEYLTRWFAYMEDVGVAEALRNGTGDYNIPYQTIMALFVLLDRTPLKPLVGNGGLFAIKGLSILFDYLLAGLAASIVYQTTSKNTGRAMLAYGAVLFTPVVFLNSALWAQCDAIYSFFGIAAVYSMIREKPLHAWVMMGISFAFKLQAVFFLPFLLVCYFLPGEGGRRRYSLLHIPAGVAAFYLCSLPGILAGRGLLAPFQIYAMQTGEYTEMTLNLANFWQLFVSNYGVMHGAATMLAVGVIGIGAMFALYRREEMNDTYRLLLGACWFVFTAVMFLPAMHERYDYAVTILLVILALLDRRAVPILASVTVVDCASYSGYFFGTADYESWTMLYALLFFGAWVGVSMLWAEATHGKSSGGQWRRSPVEKG